MIRVGIIASEYPPYLVGGLATHVQQLALGLSRKGCMVDIFASHHDLNEVVHEGEIRIQFLRLPGNTRKSPYRFTIADIKNFSPWLVENAVRFWKRAARLPDVIHIHDWHGYMAANQMRHLLGTPIVATIHALHAAFVPRFGTGPESGHVIEMERQCCQGVDRLITVSRSLQQDTVTAYGIPESRIETIYNGFDLQSFAGHQRERMKHDSERAQLLKPGERAIVYAGRLAPQKGLLALLLSAIQVLKREPDVRYLIAGDAAQNGYTDLLFSLVKNHRVLRERVTFLGMVPRERLSMVYSLASVVVVPSLYEPFGYAATEPMALGKAVVATDTGGLSEIIIHGESGLLVPLKWSGEDRDFNVDVEKLCEAQCIILRDSSFAAKLGQAARCRIATEFSLENMVNSTLRCYGKTMDAAGFLKKAS